MAEHGLLYLWSDKACREGAARRLALLLSRFSDCRTCSRCKPRLATWSRLRVFSFSVLSHSSKKVALGKGEHLAGTEAVQTGQVGGVRVSALRAVQHLTQVVKRRTKRAQLSPCSRCDTGGLLTPVRVFHIAFLRVRRQPELHV